MSTELRVIAPDDWVEFRALRLRALADSPDAFGVTLAEAAAQAPSVWRARAAGPGPQVGTSAASAHDLLAPRLFLTTSGIDRGSRRLGD